MDKQRIAQNLSEVFGISPDYEVVFSEHEYVEFSAMPPYSAEYMREYAPYMRRETIQTTKHRLHLNEHVVFMENGSKITAQFAVFHPAKKVWLRLLSLDESGVDKHYIRLEKYNG